MAGVEILATHEVMATTFNWYVFIIGMIIVIGGISFLAWKYPPGNEVICIVVILACLLVYGCLMAIIASCTGEEVPYCVEYKVQLSDGVPIADFLSTYEIIDQEGQILTIREKAVD